MAEEGGSGEDALQGIQDRLNEELEGAETEWRRPSESAMALGIGLLS